MHRRGVAVDQLANLHLSLVMRKPAFCICENKDADQLRGNREADLISAFVFATRIVQSLYFLNPKFQASGHLLWLYSLVCVGPGRKPRRPVFSERGSFSFRFGTLLSRNTDEGTTALSYEALNPSG